VLDFPSADAPTHHPAPPDSTLQILSRRLSRYHMLTVRQRRVLWESFLLLPVFWLGLRCLGLQRLQTWLDRTPVAKRPPLRADEAAALGAAVNIAAHHGVGPATCLTRSLLLRSILRRRGTDSDLRIGVQITDNRLVAHAWLEIAGQPINDTPDVATRFAAFDQPIAASLFP